MTDVPDSRVARESELLLRASCQPALVNHCLRSYRWAVAVAELENLHYDPELLFVSAALHDLGLLPEFDTGAAFEVDSGAATRDFALSRGWDQLRAMAAETAVVLHMAAGVTVDHGAEAYLLWHGTSADVSGERLDEIPTATVNQVLQAHPWLDFTGQFGDLVGQQAERKPTSRAGVLVGHGLLQRLEACPLAQQVP